MPSQLALKRQRLAHHSRLAVQRSTVSGPVSQHRPLDRGLAKLTNTAIADGDVQGGRDGTVAQVKSVQVFVSGTEAMLHRSGRNPVDFPSSRHFTVDLDSNLISVIMIACQNWFVFLITIDSPTLS
jgi:hypothetical protein